MLCLCSNAILGACADQKDKYTQGITNIACNVNDTIKINRTDLRQTAVGK